MYEFDNSYLINVYQPCSGDNLKFLDYRVKWDKFMLNYLSDLKKIKKVIYMGDMNVAHLNIDTHSFKNNDKHPSFTPEE